MNDGNETVIKQQENTMLWYSNEGENDGANLINPFLSGLVVYT